MSLQITITEQHFDTLELVPPENRIEILRILANTCINAMKSRVYDGESLEGGSFKPYSKSYRKWKEKKGRSPGSKGDWLKYTGQMIESMVIAELDPEHFVVGFHGNRIEGLSNAMLAWINQQSRPFVGLTDEEKVEVIEQTVQQAISQGLL